MRLVRASGWLLLALLFAVALMTLLGARLPRQHDAAASITIEASQGKVWSLIENVDEQPSWRHELRRVEPLPGHDDRRCWIEVQKHMRLPLCEEVTAAPITRVIAIADPNLSFGGTWTWTLTALTPDSTAVALYEHGTTDPALWRFLEHYVFREDTSIRLYERELKTAAEAR